MLDKEFFKFKDTHEVKADYTPQYQLTKLANDRYQVYDFSENKAQIHSAKNALKALASIRGGRCLDKALTSKVLAMDNFETITVAASATKLCKKAGYKTDREPWKVVAVNDVEYFVSAEDDAEQEAVKKVTASLHKTKHTYTVHIAAHNVREIAKIAACAEQVMQAVPGTTQIPTQEEISFDMQTEELPQEAQVNIQKALEQEGVYLPDNQVSVHNDMCPCGCGANVYNEPVVQAPEQAAPVSVPEAVIPGGEFVLIPVASTKQIFASSVSTLKKYAANKFANYKIYDSKKQVVASVVDGEEAHLDPKSASFEEELNAFLDKQMALSTTAEVLDQRGNVKPEGADVQQGDTIVNEQTGVATKVNEVKAEDEQPGLVAEGADEPEQGAEAPEQAAPAGQPVQDNMPAEGDKKGDDVKRWKGMKQDEDSGKYIVYVTESTEKIFDNAEEAINFMTRA